VEVILAGAGMLACMALMMVVIPLGRWLIGRARSGSAEPSRAPDGQEDR
jgi:hypothetical protein